MDDWISTTKRVYAGLRAEIVNGSYRPGERLDAAMLAQRYRTSITPVREALNRLAGEDLVEALSHQGFRIPILSDADLRALYDWACEQLIAALRLSPRGLRAQPEMARWPREADYAQQPVEATEQFCMAIAQLSANVTCCRAVERMNAQLRPVRKLESALITKPTEALVTFPGVLVRGIDAASKILITYHRVRREAATGLVGLLAMQNPPSSRKSRGPSSQLIAPAGARLPIARG